MSAIRSTRDTVIAPHFRSKSSWLDCGPYLLDVVVAQGAAILELLAGEDQALLVRGNALLVLDLGLDVVDGVARLDIKGDGLTRQGLDETISHRISPGSSSPPWVWVVLATDRGCGS
jgi:hypothetical protein